MLAILAVAVAVGQAMSTHKIYYKESRSGTIQEKTLDCKDLDSRNKNRSFSTWRNVNLKLVTHGFMSNGKSVSGIKKAWLDGRKGANTRVIILDWAKLANPLKDPATWFDDPPYTKAAKNALDVGAALGKCLAELVRKGLDQNKIHLVGHSLGAHLVGKAGREFTNQRRRQKVGRVTGLDPAGPRWVGDYEGKELAREKLSKDSAEFVDVIHTNGDTSGRVIRNLGTHFGALQPLGHIDFYPDGGRNQQICKSRFRQKQAACSHSQAVEWFHQSIKDTRDFKGEKCEKYENCIRGTKRETEYMGEGVSKRGRGTYFVRVPTSGVVYDYYS